MKYIVAFIISIMFIGCVQQPARISSTQYPQVQIKQELTEKFKNNLVSSLSDLGFYIVTTSKYRMDFRKDYAPGEESTARALMQAVDGSTINSRGIDFYIIPNGNITTIRAKPYIYKTFPFGKFEKYDMSTNNNFFNQVQTILNIVKDDVE